MPEILFYEPVVPEAWYRVSPQHLKPFDLVRVRNPVPRRQPLYIVMIEGTVASITVQHDRVVTFRIKETGSGLHYEFDARDEVWIRDD